MNYLIFSYYDTVQTNSCQLRRNWLQHSGCLWYAPCTNLAEWLGIKNAEMSSVRYHLGIQWLHKSHLEEHLVFMCEHAHFGIPLKLTGSTCQIKFDRG